MIVKDLMIQRTIEMSGKPVRMGGVTFYMRLGRLHCQLSKRERGSGKEWARTPARMRAVEKFTAMKGVNAHARKAYRGLAVWEAARRRNAPWMTAENYREMVMSPYYDEQGRVADFEHLVVSEGDLLLPQGMTMEQEGGRVTLRWDAGQDEARARPGDALRVFEVNEGRPQRLGRVEVYARRGDGVATFAVGVKFGPQVHVYPFFEREGEGRFSPNSHMRAAAE